MRSPQYINLAIIEHFVNNFCHWSTKHDKSEATFYRHFASILDILLADTDVIIADGETGLQSSKVAIAMNKAVFHTGDLSQSYGHKIDMILKCSTTTNVDISSNEWKKANVSKSIKLCQQSKNLRLNMSNLFILEAKFGVDFTIAVDFVGNAGYLYMLRLIHDGPDDHDHVAVAHMITTIAIPANMGSLGALKEALEGILTYLRTIWSLSVEKSIP